ncbi:protein C19orf12 homolog [Dermacentor variabilis]|uniref:protein C19orf12 homolog n=1 Tax=Dermacentor variabilis TaxID=34621 RepID=UPI003F5AE471
MPVKRDEMLDVLCMVSKEENLRVTLKHSVKGGLITGATAMVAGILMGPIGLAVGGALGGCAAAIMMQDKFVSAAEIISNMSDDQKDDLITAVQRAFAEIEVADVVELAALLCGDIHIKKRIIRGIIDYFHSQMQLEIID